MVYDQFDRENFTDELTEFSAPGEAQISLSYDRERELRFRKEEAPKPEDNADKEEADKADKEEADKEQAELEFIMTYLPEQMSREAIAAVVQTAIAETGAAGPQDMGKVMSRVMPEVRGKAQGREVNAIASELLKGAGG